MPPKQRYRLSELRVSDSDDDDEDLPSRASSPPLQPPGIASSLNAVSHEMRAAAHVKSPSPTINRARSNPSSFREADRSNDQPAEFKTAPPPRLPPRIASAAVLATTASPHTVSVPPRSFRSPPRPSLPPGESHPSPRPLKTAPPPQPPRRAPSTDLTRHPAVPCSCHNRSDKKHRLSCSENREGMSPEIKMSIVREDPTHSAAPTRSTTTSLQSGVDVRSPNSQPPQLRSGVRSSLKSPKAPENAAIPLVTERGDSSDSLEFIEVDESELNFCVMNSSNSTLNSHQRHQGSSAAPNIAEDAKGHHHHLRNHHHQERQHPLREGSMMDDSGREVTPDSFDPEKDEVQRFAPKVITADKHSDGAIVPYNRNSAVVSAEEKRSISAARSANLFAQRLWERQQAERKRMMAEVERQWSELTFQPNHNRSEDTIENRIEVVTSQPFYKRLYPNKREKEEGRTTQRPLTQPIPTISDRSKELAGDRSARSILSRLYPGKVKQEPPVHRPKNCGSDEVVKRLLKPHDRTLWVNPDLTFRPAISERARMIKPRDSVVDRLYVPTQQGERRSSNWRLGEETVFADGETGTGGEGAGSLPEAREECQGHNSEAAPGTDSVQSADDGDGNNASQEEREAAAVPTDCLAEEDLPPAVDTPALNTDADADHIDSDEVELLRLLNTQLNLDAWLTPQGGDE